MSETNALEMLDGLFGDKQDKKNVNQETKDLPLALLIPFKDHPFKLYSGSRLDSLVESIRKHGVLQSITVRPHPDQDGCYEILAGHNRSC